MTVVTCGDCAAEQLRAAGLASDVIIWRDILHEGPVPAGHDLDGLSAVRAEFLANLLGTAPASPLADFLSRNARLRAAAGRPLTLWFDHNLVNQLQLLQVLDALSQLDPAEVWLAGPHTFGGASADQLHWAYDERQRVTPDHLELARQAWAAFTAPDPAALSSLAARDLTPFPGLATALRRHLRQFPHTRDGLGQTERRGLEAVAAGLTDVVDVFVAHADGDDPPFMGDSTFRHYLERLARGSAPLLQIDGSGRCTLTGAGARVLDGAADQVDLNGIDRWYGGVHLTGHATWRWDDQVGLHASAGANRPEADPA